MATLQTIADHPAIPEAIRTAVRLEGTANTRNQATLGGRLVAFDGRSALITTLVAADALTIWDDDQKQMSLGEWLALPDQKPGKLLVAVKFSRKTTLALEVVNRTKLDLPLVCVAAAKWPAGRTRLAVGGFGKCPQMAFDGQDAEGAEMAVENACRNSGDFRASEEYRRAMSIILTRRCLEKTPGIMMMNITLSINSKDLEFNVPAGTTLLEVLRTAGLFRQQGCQMPVRRMRCLLGRDGWQAG